VFVAAGLHASAGAVLLVLAAGARLSAYVGATVGELGFLRGFWVYGARRLAWLEDYAASLAPTAELPAPERLERGVRFEHVSFAYPAPTGLASRTSRSISRPVPSSRWWARTGREEHAREAAGEMCRPHRGQILIDDVPLTRITRSRGARGWLAPFRISSASSFARGLAWAWAMCHVWT
jgi:ATP-binding cassette subfamily B protein